MVKHFCNGAVMVAAGAWVTLAVVGDLRAQAREDSVISEPIAMPLDLPAGLVGRSITSLNGAALRAQGLLTLAEALRLVPGTIVSEAGEFGGATAVVALRGTAETQVLVMVDGVPLNELGALDLAHLSLDNVERIDVVRGPAGAAAGPNALGGVVLIRTTRPAGRSAAARFQQGRGGVSVLAGEAVVAGRRAGVAFAASRLESNGIVISGETYVRRTAAASARLGLAHTDIELSASLTGADYLHPVGSRVGVDGRNINSADRAVRAAPRTQRDDISRGLASVRVMHRVGERLRLDALVAAHGRSFGFTDTAGAVVRQISDVRQSRRRTASELRGTYAIAPRLDVGGGLAFEQLRERDWNVVTRDSFPSRTSGHWITIHTRAVFFDAVWHADRLAIAGSVRRNDFRDGPSLTSWHLGAMLAARPATRLRASVGYSAGGFGFPDGLVDTLDGPAALRPEGALSAEVGAEHRIGDRFAIGVSLVHQRLADIISFAVFTTPPGLRTENVNIGTAIATGADLQVTFTPAPGVTLQPYVSWLPMRIARHIPNNSGFREGSRLNGRPDLTAGGSLALRLGSLARLRVQMAHIGPRHYFTDRVFSGSGASLPAYTIVDAGALLTLPGGISGVLRVDNLFNRGHDIRPVDLSAPGFGSYPGRRRTILAGAGLTL